METSRAEIGGVPGAADERAKARRSTGSGRGGGGGSRTGGTKAAAGGDDTGVRHSVVTGRTGTALAGRLLAE